MGKSSIGAARIRSGLSTKPFAQDSVIQGRRLEWVRRQAAPRPELLLPYKSKTRSVVSGDRVQRADGVGPATPVSPTTNVCYYIPCCYEQPPKTARGERELDLGVLPAQRDLEMAG